MYEAQVVDRIHIVRLVCFLVDLDGSGDIVTCGIFQQHLR